IEIADGNTDVFINLDLKTLEAHPGLARTIMGALLNAVYNRNGRGPGAHCSCSMRLPVLVFCAFWRLHGTQAANMASLSFCCSSPLARCAKPMGGGMRQANGSVILPVLTGLSGRI